MKEWDRNMSQIQNTDENGMQNNAKYGEFPCSEIGGRNPPKSFREIYFDEFQQEKPMWFGASSVFSIIPDLLTSAKFPGMD